jgi:hypothetical protein
MSPTKLSLAGSNPGKLLAFFYSVCYILLRGFSIYILVFIGFCTGKFVSRLTSVKELKYVPQRTSNLALFKRL